jgi:hypothetical protein
MSTGEMETPGVASLGDGNPVKRPRGARTEAELRELAMTYGTRWPGDG